MDPAASAAKAASTILTFEEETNARSLYNADMWQRHHAQLCWADRSPVGRFLDLSCTNEAWRGCSLGLCEAHCKEVHVDTRSRFHRQPD